MNRVQKGEQDNDQAGELRSRIERHKAKSLPKRSKIHQNKKKKGKVKFKFPIIKALALFFILLPIGFYSLYSYLQKLPAQDPKLTKSFLKMVRMQRKRFRLQQLQRI